MKARDIIPGWPKGRSTSSAYWWDCVWWDFGIPGQREAIREAALTQEYHAAQQRMATSHIESRLNQMVFHYNHTVPFRSDGSLERAIALAKARVDV